ncbi:MAG TPA: ABC transporter permease, partial [Thermomicrobiales bacterium]|nr:ABC transporter permease [Thermomicrobiales bacterium]
MTDSIGSLSAAATNGAALQAGGRRGEMRSIWRVARQRFLRHRAAAISLVILCLEVALALAAPALIPADLATRPDPLNILQPASAAHWLGTDEVGRDILARLIYASRISLTIGFLSVVVAVTVGTTLGSIAGYFGGAADNAIMRLTDAVLSIPVLFFLIVLSVSLGPSVRTMVIVIGLLSWMELARIIRATFLSLRKREFVEAARTIGTGNAAIIVRHILPNSLAPIVVAATLGVGNALITEATVSYLGLGVQPPTPSWGNMLYNAQSYFFNAP